MVRAFLRHGSLRSAGNAGSLVVGPGSSSKRNPRVICMMRPSKKSALFSPIPNLGGAKSDRQEMRRFALNYQISNWTQSVLRSLRYKELRPPLPVSSQNNTLYTLYPTSSTNALFQHFHQPNNPTFLIHHDWTWKGWQGPGKGCMSTFCIMHRRCRVLTSSQGAKRHRKILRDNIQGITKVCLHSATR